MSTALFILFASAVIAGVVWLVGQLREAGRRQDLARKVEARKRGWTYDGQRAGRIDYRFAGSNGGIDWQMWYDSDRGDDSPTPKAVWTTANLRTAELSLVIIGRKRFELESGVVGQLLMGAVSGIARAVTGTAVRPDKAEFYESAIELEASSVPFRQGYSVAVAPEMPRNWLDDDLQRLLVSWPTAGGQRPFDAANRTEVTLRQDGLSVVVQHMPEDLACWNHLARIGIHLSQRLQATTLA